MGRAGWYDDLGDPGVQRGASSWETMFGARYLSRYGLRPLRFWLTVWTGILLVLFGWLVLIGHL